MIQKISKLSSYAFLIMMPSGALFGYYFSRTVGGHQVTILDFALWVAFAAFAMHFCVNKRAFLPQAMDKWMLLLFGVCMFFVYWGLRNGNEHALTRGLRPTWTLLLLYFPLSHLAATDNEGKAHLIKFLLIYSTIVGLSAIPLRFGLFAPVVDPIWQAGPVGEFSGMTPEYGADYRTTWVCRTTYVRIALCLCLGIFVFRRDLLRLAGGRIGWSLCVGANIVLVLLSKGRTTLLMTVSAVVLCASFLLLFSRQRSRVAAHLATFTVVIIIAVAISALFLQEDILYYAERISGLDLKDRTVQMRMLTAEKDIENFLESPIIGKGLGFADWFYYRQDMMWRKTYGEVGITRMLVWFGLLGTTVIYAFLVWLLVRSLKLLRHSNSSLEKVIGAVCAAQIIVMMISGFVFTACAIMLILVAVLLRKVPRTHTDAEPAESLSAGSQLQERQGS